jgi:hypothetical protein
MLKRVLVTVLIIGNQKFSWGGARPLPKPLPVGEGAHPPPQTPPPLAASRLELLILVPGPTQC